MDLVFGWRTAILTVAAAILLPLATALWSSLRNRVAARTLAAALVAMTGVFLPWLIGFAGFYDRWRWLTFTPFSNPLLIPPLLYLHAHALIRGRWPDRGWRHLVPGTTQFACGAGAFLLPMRLKEQWSAFAYPALDAVGALLLAASFALYGSWIAKLLRSYRTALAAERSDDALFAAAWIDRAMAAFTGLAVLWAAYLLTDAVVPLGYKGLMPLYTGIAGFALYLGIAGWRHLALPFPELAALQPPPPVPTPARDWSAQGAVWAARTRAALWYREDSLTLRRLAALLATNESYLSRALNEGLGMTFSEFVNGLRCEEVASALQAGDPRPVLALAMDAGFASKASFNRAFQQRFGCAPSAMRASHNP